jgi:hypothetical protein
MRTHTHTRIHTCADSGDIETEVFVIARYAGLLACAHAHTHVDGIRRGAEVFVIALIT